MRCLNRAEIKVNTLFCHLHPGIDSWATLLPTFTSTFLSRRLTRILFQFERNQCTNCSAAITVLIAPVSKLLHSHLRNAGFHYRVLVHIFMSPISLILILVLSSVLHRSLPSGCFPSSFKTEIMYQCLVFPISYPCCIPHFSYPVSFNQPNNLTKNKLCQHLSVLYKYYAS